MFEGFVFTLDGQTIRLAITQIVLIIIPVILTLRFYKKHKMKSKSKKM